MNILMMSNTYLPFVGGVERSIEMFTQRLGMAGHRVVIVVPDSPDTLHNEKDILRMPAIQRFNGSDFSVEVPIPGLLEARLKEFKPDLIHSHHPFLIGDTALRIATHFQIPVVFTFHSFYEHYTHYVGGNSESLKKFIIALSAGYANLCDQVIAPCESVRDIITSRGVHKPITIVPTGINVAAFKAGNRPRYRTQEQIPDDGFVIGMVSRIAPEKNIIFLAQAVSMYLSRNAHAHFFMVGQGPSVEDVRSIFNENGVGARLHVLGTLQGSDLIDVYHAFDIFVYASLSETQGIVLCEAMAAGVPVIALDAPGVREVVQDKLTGRLLSEQNIESLVRALTEFALLPDSQKADYSRRAVTMAEQFTEEITTAKLLTVYQAALNGNYADREINDSSWDEAKRWLSKEWKVIANIAHATGTAMAMIQ